ncbi:hypothetical protein [Nocardia goodfellowii]|uniref:Uncharacterized protein n=1 Tax=Nocardia goodfellowii TaxID=882446 RepID=A0ABS4QUA4_9NOCA|nr:hypothetical protein [Nocardia goodfellowii]MBP2194186.1 hypothetical protein [Nocardia goodfellowii]
MRHSADIDRFEQPTTRFRGWATATAILVVLYMVSFLTLPAVEEFMHQNAIELGWIVK